MIENHWSEVASACGMQAASKEDFLHNSSFHVLPAGNIHELSELLDRFTLL